jgi:hypothetical protein
LAYDEQNRFYTEGILPCEYCGGDCYIGDSKEYLKNFLFTNLQKTFQEKEKMNIDHLVQCSNGGKGEISNGVVCCSYCNKEWLKDVDVIIKTNLRNRNHNVSPMEEDSVCQKTREFTFKNPFSMK